MELYKSIQGSTFRLIHCWNELRFAPKWLIDNSHKKTKSSKNASPATSSPSTQDSINLGDNEVGDTFVGLERPMGRKASKERVRNEKGKRIADMSAASTLKFEEYMEDIKVRDKKRQEEKDRLHAQEQHRLAIEEEKNRIKNEKLQFERSKEEERIIAIDTTDMP